MKWTTAILSLAYATSTVQAAPVPDDGGLALYNLKISCPVNPEVDGRYLSISGSTVGLFDAETSPLRVYQTSSEKKGCSQLHTYPVGIVDHALGLVGDPGFMTLTDMVNPQGFKPDDGEVSQWDTFQVSSNKLTNNGKGNWLAFPTDDNSWEITWSDGTMMTTEDFMPVQVMMEAAGEGRYNE